MKYLKKGDQKRGLPAIHKRWEEIQAESMKKADLSQAEARAEHIRLSGELLAKFETAIANLDPGELSPHALVNGFVKLIELREALLGADKGGNSEPQRDDPISDMTADEALEYIRTGRFPLRLNVAS